MTEHHLKTQAEFWHAVQNGSKPFEVRLDDRNFQVGDILHLHRGVIYHEGPVLRARVTYKLDGGQFGVEMGYCVLGLALEWGLRHEP